MALCLPYVKPLGLLARGKTNFKEVDNEMTFAKLTWWLVNIIGWIPVPVWESEPEQGEAVQ